MLCANLFPLSATAVDTDVEINSTNFPDTNFRDFVSTTCDKNHDNFLSQSEISGTRNVDINNKQISDLKGIEYFKDTSFLDVSGNNLTSFDFLNKLPNLTEFISLNGNSLSSIDLSKNTNLTYLQLSYLNITALDISKNTQLDFLKVHDTKISSLDVSNNTKLKHMDVSYNKLTNIRYGDNDKLTYLDVIGNSMPTLDLSSSIFNSLETLNFGRVNTASAVSVDLSGCINLKDICFYYCSLKSLDLSKQSKLEKLNCMSNSIETLDLSHCPLLKTLKCSDNQLKKLDLSNCPLITSVDCSDNKLLNINAPSSATVTCSGQCVELGSDKNMKYDFNSYDSTINDLSKFTFTPVDDSPEITKEGTIVSVAGNPDSSKYTFSNTNGLSGTLDLSIGQADYTELGEIYASFSSCEEILDYQNYPEHYTEESVNALMDFAYNIHYDLKINQQSIVDGYCESLRQLIHLKRVSADYTQMNSILSTIPTDLSVYTQETVDSLNNVKDGIDMNLDYRYQSTVDNKTEQLQNAISSLVLKTTAGTKTTTVNSNNGTKVNNLNSIFKSENIVTDGTKGVTNTDLSNNQSVNITVKVADKTKETAEKLSDIITKANGMKVTQFFDITVEKTVSKNNSVLSTTKLTEVPDLLQFSIPLSKELQGKESYSIFRNHNGQIDEITTTPNADGEYIELSSDGESIELYVKKFSTYAIGYTEKSVSGNTGTTVAPTNPSNSAKTDNPKTGNNIPISLMILSGLSLAGYVFTKKKSK